MSWLSNFGTGGKTRAFDESHICGFTARNDKGEKIGTVDDYIMDGENRLRYLVVSTGLWGLGKNITIPAGMAQVDDRAKEVVFSGITRQQAEQLPAYDANRGFDEEYESQLMRIYYPKQEPHLTPKGQLDYERYNQFCIPERIQLLEERLQIQKRAELEGNVVIGKHVESREETIDVPVSHERVVIEHKPVSEATQATEGMNLHEESFTVPLYKEEIEVTKHPVIAEEVTIRKEKETETRTVRETVGREKLDIDDPNHLTADRGIAGNVREDIESAKKKTAERKETSKTDAP